MRGTFQKTLKTMVPVMAVMASMLAAPAMAEIKMGVVDFRRVLEESPQFKAVVDSLRNEANAKVRDLQALETSLKTKVDRLTRDRATMSADQVARMEREIRDGERDLARRRAEAQEDTNLRQNEEIAKVQQVVINEIRAYAQAQKFDVVMADGVIYASQSLDITQAVLQSLQSRAAAAKPPAAR